MYYEYEPEKDYFRKGALEINIEVREREKQMALLAVELKAEEEEIAKQNQSPVMSFLSNLFGGLRAPNPAR